jgi:hypothetical protein
MAPTTHYPKASRYDARNFKESSMLRHFVGSVAAILMLGVAVPVSAQEKSADSSVVSSTEVVPTWAIDTASQPSSKAVKLLCGSYGVLQGLDMYSTIVARQRGAVEVNPLMNTGFTQTAVFKAVMGATTMMSVKALENKSKKAAIITMVALNSATAIIVANNVRNARRLR